MLRESPSHAGAAHAAPSAGAPSRCSRSSSRSSVLALDALAGAATPPVGKRGIDVVQVEGYLDPPNVSLILDAIKESNAAPFDAPRPAGEVERRDRHEHRRGRAGDPEVAGAGRGVGGPVGCRRQGRGHHPVAGRAPRRTSHRGPAPDPVNRCGSTTRTRARAPASPTASPRSPQRNGRDPDGARKLATEPARIDRGAYAVRRTNGVRPTIGELIVQLDGKKVTTAAGELTLSTAKVIGTGKDRRRQPNQEVVFNRLGLGDSLLHRLISPSIAYFLIVVGLALIVFEFYTASIGLAGLVGALCLIGAFVGFSHLPGPLVGARTPLRLDVRVRHRRAGRRTRRLDDHRHRLPGHRIVVPLRRRRRSCGPSWWVFLVVIGGTLLFMLGGMTAMIRSRFSTPTVGREGMIGEEGVAEVAVDPDGVVLIRGARWRARTNRATPIQAGEPVKVASVEGLVLEVEPPEGGAQDYRERARNRRSKSEE